MSEGADFIIEEAILRGIDPQTAIDVASSEGGVDFPGEIGEFTTGTSFWQYQLHYGGPDYPQYGIPSESLAGMGNDFTALTTWAPGDPAACRDACRYALNRAKADGWGAWYGAAAQGITGYDGIDDSPWDPNSQVWDYEMTSPPSTPPPTYNPLEPAHLQENDWDCSVESTEWALFAWGRTPDDNWIEDSMISAGVVDPALGLLDASGAGLANWVNVEYGPDGYLASNVNPVSFDDLAWEAATLKHPIMFGGRAWYHWSGLRGYDPVRDCLLLANPAPGWKGVYQTMNRSQFSQLGSFSMVRLTHPQAESGQKPPGLDYSPWEGRVGSGLIEMMQADHVLPAQDYSTWLPLGRYPAQIEECIAESGVTYRWLLGTNRGFRYAPLP